MKQLFFILGFLFFSFTTSNAQINLINSITPSTYLDSFSSNTKGIMFYTKDTITNQIKLYNEDFSIYKTVIINRPIGYKLSVYCISEQLFNSNTSIEFICNFNKISNSNINGSSSILRLYDDNGTILKDFGTTTYAYGRPTVLSKGSANLLLVEYSYYTSINPYSYGYVYQTYSLPGSMPNSVSELSMSDVQPAYPNPSKVTVNLPYSLDNGQTTSMRIYKLNGQLMEQKQIDSNFDKIQLNIGSYQSGVYIYEYNGISKKFVVN